MTKQHCVVEQRERIRTVKHRHRLAQRARQRPASPSRRADVNEDEQPSSGAGKAKRRAAHHMHAEGKRPKLRLDKFRRGGRSRNTYDNGGPAGSSAASTRSADDPGNEIAGADRDRPKSTLERLGRELMGPKSAYKHGGRQKHRGYDAGGAAPPPPPSFNTPSGSDFAFSAKPNPIVAMVQKNMPPIDRAMSAMQARATAPPAPLPKAVPSFPGAPKIPVPGIKKGGRVKRGTAR